MHNILEKIYEIGIVPVIKIDDIKTAVPLAKALMKGGIPCAEITFRTEHGEEAIRQIAKEVPEILVGAGTITSCEQVDRALNAGAKFIVSPGFNPKVVEYCISKNVPITPGCSSPTDIEKALELGLEVVKFFPAEQSGGLEFIKAVAAPYTSIKFMPTGGINESNIVKYLSFNKILACGGSWMVPSNLVNNGNFDEIISLCKNVVKTVLGFELAHVGINETSEQNATEGAKKFESMFGFTCKSGVSSVFAGKYVELLKSPYLGKNGHLAISTNSIKRAIAHLKRNGFEVLDDTAKVDSQGNLLAIYLKDEIGGFAIHLLQKTGGDLK